MTARLFAASAMSLLFATVAHAADSGPIVIGVPVGFVGAAEAKDALRRSGLASLSNRTEKGGPAVAVAAFEALLRLAQDPEEEPHA